jgi:hypothetical protein
VKLWASAATGAAIAWLVKLAVPPLHPIVAAIFVLGAYGGAFFGAVLALRIPEASAAWSRMVRGARL